MVDIELHSFVLVCDDFQRSMASFFVTDKTRVPSVIEKANGLINVISFSMHEEVSMNGWCGQVVEKRTIDDQQELFYWDIYYLGTTEVNEIMAMT